MLGVQFIPESDGMPYIEAMKKKGMEWANRLKTRPLPPQDAWLSFHMQLSRSMSYGLGSVVIFPKKLDKLMQLVYCRILLLLNVNRCIDCKWRTLSPCYQGLGLPDWIVDCLTAKFYLVVRLWGFSSASAHLMIHTYEAFRMEVGLFGNILL